MKTGQSTYENLTRLCSAFPPRGTGPRPYRIHASDGVHCIGVRCHFHKRWHQHPRHLVNSEQPACCGERGKLDRQFDARSVRSCLLTSDKARAGKMFLFLWLLPNFTLDRRGAIFERGGLPIWALGSMLVGMGAGMTILAAVGRFVPSLFRRQELVALFFLSGLFLGIAAPVALAIYL